MTTAMDAAAETAARALSLRMFRAMLATQEAFAAYLGVKLDLYQTVNDGGPMTVDQFAARTGIAARYAREWLEQQAVSGLLAVDDPALPWDERAYQLPPGHDRVLLASDDPLSLVSTALLPIGGVARALPALLAAYRTGDGIPAEVFGVDWRDGHGGANRAAYTHQLAGWLRLHLPDVHRRLAGPGPRRLAGPGPGRLAGPGPGRVTRIADVGCGAGWATIALAHAYPNASVAAVDIDAEAVAGARQRFAEHDLADRVTCHTGDVSTLSGRFDLVCLFDVVHELARPVETLRACRELSGVDGTVLVLEGRMGDTFTAPGDDIERFQYATSVLHCLPAGLHGPAAVGTGTAMRAHTMHGYARAAGFGRVTGHDLNDRFHRLYRLDSAPTSSD